MRNIVRRLHKKLIESNKGLSLITVIVSIAFVSILVSVLLTVSAVNFKMRTVNSFSKNSFYSAEQVLDEINVGLQQTVSDALSSSYKQVLENYDVSEMTSAEKNKLVRTRYYKYLWDKLAVGGSTGSHNTYIAYDQGDGTKGLYGYLKDSTKWHADASPENEYGAFLRSTSEVAGSSGSVFSGKLTTYEESGIVLEDLTVYYKDVNGLVSTIKTDIRLAYPEFTFSSGDVPEVSTYCFIADGGYEEEGKHTTTICGNTYASYIKSKETDYDFTEVKEDSVVTPDLHIVANTIDMKKGGIKTNKNSTLWTSGIVAKSADVELNGSTYVLDDLNITGKGTNVRLAGTYNGYGNSVTKPGDSSAILVNGTDANIDMSKIEKIVLAGHAYVGTKDKKIRTDASGKNITDDDAYNDVYTGESIAIKSNQLMYLVPAECIGVDKTTGTSLYNKNPLTATEYQKIHDNPSQYTEISTSTQVAKLSSDLSAYVAMSGSEPDIERVFVRTADATGTLIYFYMKFRDENAANEYFARYYTANKERADKYLSFYLNELKFPESGMGSLRVKLAGNALGGSKSSEEGYHIVSYVVEDSSKKLQADYEDYLKQFEGYCSKLSGDYETLASGGAVMRLHDEADTSKEDFKYMPYNTGSLFKNIIDEDKLKIVCDGSGVKYFSDDSGDHVVEMIYSTNVNDTVSIDTGCSLVIANCGVEVNGDFTGTIIAKGKVSQTKKANNKYTADREAVEEAFLLENTIDDIDYKVSYVFKDNDDILLMSGYDPVSDDTALSIIVTYENWTKE